MTRKDFITFIEELGFVNTWLSIDDKYSMPTDVVALPNQNGMAFTDQLKIVIIDDIVQLTLSQMSSLMMGDKNFGNFSLKTFGQKDDFQLEIFMSFIKSSFNKLPNTITQYMRDMNIKDILND